MANNSNNWNFERGLDDDFMKKLECVAKEGGWFADVLRDHDLILGIRKNYVNVYEQGQSLFKIERNAGKGSLKFSTHPKYLVDPDLYKPVSFDGSNFRVHELKPLIREYTGPKTLAQLKRAAKLYRGDEKHGVHHIVRANPNVVDTEIAFSRETGAESEAYVPRIDLACFEDVNGSIRLRFWEAKLYGNNEIRADGDTLPPVVEQVSRYQKLVEKHRKELVESYRVVARNLVAIAQWADGQRTVGELVERVARGEDFVIDEPPVVGLVVFGYDGAQKVNARW